MTDTPESVTPESVPEIPAPETVQSPSESQPQIPDIAVIRESLWNRLVEQGRVAVRRAKKLDEKAIIELPGDKFRYVKFALNRHGLYSMPRPKGKIKHHWSKRQLQLKDMALMLFRDLFMAYEKQLRVEQGAAYEGVPNAIVQKLGELAARQASRAVLRNYRLGRKGQRTRQKTARRINFGLLPGNARRDTHAAG